MPYKKDGAAEVVEHASRILGEGGVVAYPTESFYALGVSVFDEKAVRKLFALKERPPEKPLPVIVGDDASLLSIVKKIPDEAKAIMEKFWPGPLTLIFEAVDDVPDLLTANTGRVAVRVPGESAALEMVRALKLPVTATSANPSGAAPAGDMQMIGEYFNDRIEMAVDGGKTPGGLPSTILDMTVSPPKILRQGRVSLEL